MTISNSLEEIIFEVSDVLNSYLNRTEVMITDIGFNISKRMNQFGQSSAGTYISLIRLKKTDKVFTKNKKRDAEKISILLDEIFIEEDDELIKKLRNHYGQDFTYPPEEKSEFKTKTKKRMGIYESKLRDRTKLYLKSIKNNYAEVYQVNKDIVDQIEAKANHLIDLRLNRSEECIEKKVCPTFSKVNESYEPLPNIQRLGTINKTYIRYIGKLLQYSDEEEKVLQDLIDLTSKLGYKSK